MLDLFIKHTLILAVELFYISLSTKNSGALFLLNVKLVRNILSGAANDEKLVVLFKKN